MEVLPLVLLGLLELEGLLVVPVHISADLLLDPLIDELEESLFIHTIVEVVGYVFVRVEPWSSLVLLELLLLKLVLLLELLCELLEVHVPSGGERR